MNTFSKAALGAACSLVCMPLAAQANETERAAVQDPALTDLIVVTGQRASADLTDELAPPPGIALPADTADIAARIPGGALVGNGALSGQLSYRGLTGERVLGRVNGQRFATGGPNAMDPPLHYAPSVLVESVAIARGVAPVSQGPSLAGVVDARLVQADFAQGSSAEWQTHFAAQYRSVDNSYAAGGLLGLVNSAGRLEIAVRDGSAARELGEGRGLAVSIRTGGAGDA